MLVPTSFPSVFGDLKRGKASLDRVRGQQVSWWGTDNVYVIVGE